MPNILTILLRLTSCQPSWMARLKRTHTSLRVSMGAHWNRESWSRPCLVDDCLVSFLTKFVSSVLRTNIWTNHWRAWEALHSIWLHLLAQSWPELRYLRSSALQDLLVKTDPSHNVWNIEKKADSCPVASPPFSSLPHQPTSSKTMQDFFCFRLDIWLNLQAPASGLLPHRFHLLPASLLHLRVWGVLAVLKWKCSIHFNLPRDFGHASLQH